MQVEVRLTDPDYLGVPGTFVPKPAQVEFHTTWVVEARSVARSYTNYRWDVSIVHVVVGWRKGTDRAECRCGLLSYGRYAFEIHQRPWAFRSSRFAPHVEIPRFEPQKWHRLCSRCVA